MQAETCPKCEDLEDKVQGLTDRLKFEEDMNSKMVDDLKAQLKEALESREGLIKENRKLKDERDQLQKDLSEALQTCKSTKLSQTSVVASVSNVVQGMYATPLFQVIHN